MSLIVEDGTAKADANTYVDSAGTFASDYAAGHLYATSWTAASSENKEKAVRMATRVLDASVEWNGRPVTGSQALQWPRTGVSVNGWAVASNAIPTPLKAATMELAIALLTRDRTSDTAGSAETKKIGLGDGALEIEFTEGSDPAAAKLPILPDMVFRLVKDYGARVGASSGMTRVRRA